MARGEGEEPLHPTRRGVRVEVEGDLPVVRGDHRRLVELVQNLLENAAKFSRRRVRVSAGDNGLGQMIAVIEDDGPGLPADRREEVMKRGARLDESAPGSGLGLSIVDDLTRAYGGRLTLGDSDLGGLKAVLELPAAQLERG